MRRPAGATEFSNGRKPIRYVFHTQTSTEYWQKRGCLAHTDGKGNDLRIPDNVRIYVIASAQHNSPFGSEPAKDDTQQPINPLPAGDVLRALMVAMDLWVTQGIPPPPSQYPTVKDRTLVSPNQQHRFSENSWRALRGAAQPPAVSRLRPAHSATAKWRFIRRNRSTTASIRYSCRKLIEDGNDIAGIRLPAVQVPIGTLHRLESTAARLGRRRIGGLARLLHSFCKDKSATAQEPAIRACRSQERYKNRDRLCSASQPRRATCSSSSAILLPEDAERMIAEAKKRRIP